MIELNDKQRMKFDLQSSKGNQFKWKKDNLWYKADYVGYEGLSETIVSELLKHSSLKEDEFVEYSTVQIKYNNQFYNGCVSENFLKEGIRLITLERLFQLNGIQLYKTLYKIDNLVERAEYLVSETIKITGLKDFGQYMSKMMAIDALFLNEDRHTHNIAVLVDRNGNYDYCPYFDCGAALLSDTTMDYPLNQQIGELIKHVHSKTIYTDFYEQLEVFENLYGNQIKFNFTKKDIENTLEKETNYSNEIKQRILDIILYQKNKYQYLFEEV